MSKTRKIFMIILAGGWAILMATPALARGFSLKDAGISLWIFLIIGVILILLQLIPAVILFFSFIGSVSTLAFKPKKAPEEKEIEEKERLVLPGGPLTVQK